MGPIEALANELLQRELNKPKLEWQAPPSQPRNELQALNPEVAALLGTGLDAVGTGMMLHRGTGTEGNPMHAKLWRQDPVKTGLGVAAFGVGASALRNLLRAKGGKVGGKVADILAGVTGADQMLAGLQHIDRLDGGRKGSMQRWLDTRSGETRRMERVREAVAGLRKD